MCEGTAPRSTETMTMCMEDQHDGKAKDETSSRETSSRETSSRGGVRRVGGEARAQSPSERNGRGQRSGKQRRVRENLTDIDGGRCWSPGRWRPHACSSSKTSALEDAARLQLDASVEATAEGNRSAGETWAPRDERDAPDASRRAEQGAKYWKTCMQARWPRNAGRSRSR